MPPTITTRDGRTLGIYEAGDPGGVPVIYHHGTPGSGLLYPPHDLLATEQGIRLIGYDRPGYAGSTRNDGRLVVDCIADVHSIADELGLDRFASWGISGGGPHVLACAALCDERLVAVASLAAVAPYEADGLDWFAGMGDENVDEFGAVLESREALEAYLGPARDGHMNATPEELIDVFKTLLGPADRAALTGGLATWMLETGKNGMRDGYDGWFDDDVAFAHPWGFDVGEIERPVLILHGDDDRFVPVSHGHWLAARIPDAETRIYPGDGHLTLGTNRVREAHEWLLAQL